VQPEAPFKIVIGWDAREMIAWNVAQNSLRNTVVRRSNVIIDRLDVAHLRALGWYWRPTEERDGRLWDVISEAPMSTGHAIARFLVPALCGYHGWALFTDGDVLFRSDVTELFALADERYAVQVVQHHHAPVTTTKMDGQVQTIYPRKNWSSVMLLNCGHPANRALTLQLVNSVPGRDLHRFCWLEDDLIGALPERWNALIGHSDINGPVSIAHFTEGTPDMPGYERQPFADEWRAVAKRCRYKLPEVAA
jgi:hypothetical protein